MKIRSTIILLFYISILLTGAFHSHHLEYYSDITIAEKIQDPFVNETSICIFNQINRPTYFYSFVQPFSLSNNDVGFVTQLPLDLLQISQSDHSSINLRAPPTIS